MTEFLERLGTALRGQYRVERELGQGGMARVYLARDLKHGRQVALKVLRPELAPVVGVERFLAEIRTTAALQHARILPLFDSGVVTLPACEGAPATELPYYVMPYVEGETLRARLDRERQLPVATALNIAAQVAGALDHAHRHGIVHRDIKPDNILLQDDEAVVADFGVALAIETAAGPRLTETGFAVGTPAYMSPEQSLGERYLDGRSDIYALGCVLYEMLAGDPPYTGATAQAIVARRMTQPIPSVRAVRESVPASLESAITRSLARVPADRFATGKEFASALSGTAEDTPARGRVASLARRTRVPVLAAALLLLLVAGGLVLTLRLRSRAPVLDENLLAVAPFDVNGAGLDVWHEGVVDLLARTLDGAGSLRTVSPSVVLRGWQGRSDRASAIELGRRTGAGVVATGSVTRLAAGRVQLRATLLDVRRDELLGEVEVKGAQDALGASADSLGLEILRALSRLRPVGAVRQMSITAVPLPALKAFLAGEQSYRRGEFDSAVVAYEEALSLDSGFTLALYRMGQSLQWLTLAAEVHEPADSFFARAIVRNRGVAERESLLIAADSALFHGSPRRPDLLALAMTRRETAARKFPRDPEVWYSLGEVYYHGQNGRPDYEKALAMFRRSLELDPGFAPPYEHILRLAIDVGSEEDVQWVARAGAELRTTAPFNRKIQLARRLLLLPERERARVVAEGLDSLSAGDLYDLGVDVFMALPDSSETAVQILRQLVARRLRPPDATDFVVEPRMRQRYLAQALARRGHLHEAARIPTYDLTSEGYWWAGWQDPFISLLSFDVLPEGQLRGLFAQSLDSSERIRNRYEHRWRGAPWWAARGDTLALSLFVGRMGDAIRRGAATEDVAGARILELEARGYLALARGDTLAALELFGTFPPDCELFCGRAVMEQGALLSALGRDREAITLLDQWLPQISGPLAVLGRLHRARSAERVGDTAASRRDYAYVAAAWRAADPELMPYVTEARAGVARLTGRL